MSFLIDGRKRTMPLNEIAKQMGLEEIQVRRAFHSGIRKLKALDAFDALRETIRSRGADPWNPLTARSVECQKDYAKFGEIL